ncbi:MAG: ABC transporter substrate-binding protein [Kiloniellales bacterium]|nr:ABC transporter substrate-binding protein [Kiloniellales bacterium]
MRRFTRREALTSAAGAIGAAALTPTLLAAARAFAAELPWTPEPDASIRILRWKRFVASEGEATEALLEAFSQATGVQIRLDSEGFEDLRPKAAVAANIGSGPDMIWTIHADPHLYPNAMLDLTDVAEYLGERNGGWYPIAEEYSKREGQWISLPYTFSGNFLNYRISQIKAVGFDSFPDNTDDFLAMMAELKKAGTPGGFALGNASGDGNCWAHWILWSHGGRLVDENNNLVLNSPETVAGLEYVAKLGETFLPGVASWLDGHNNKAFLQGSCSVTNNGISIYAAAQRENMTEIAEDMDHAYWPTVPGQPVQEFHVNFPMTVYNHTKYPNACKALLAWLMDAEQYSQFLQASVGYLSHTLKNFDDNPVWTADPKRAVFKDTVHRSKTFANAGTLGYAAASVFADFIVVNMVAEAALGSKTPEEAAKDAHKRAERYYRI